MKIEGDIEEFLNDIGSYAEDSGFDYSYYLVTYELKRMRIVERIGELRPEHMNPISLFLRDWMPGGWIAWSEKTGKRWKMNSELCGALNKLRNEFHALDRLDLAHFEPSLHGKAVRSIFEHIYELNLGKTKEAVATVASKIMHLLNSELFVMWDTSILTFYKCEPNPEGYLDFLTKMTGLTKQLQRHLGRIKEKAEKLRKNASEDYGRDFPEKSLAKLIDEYNWIERKRRRRSRY